MTATENPETPWFVPKLLAPLWQTLAGKAVTSTDAVAIREYDIPFTTNLDTLLDDHKRESINWILDERKRRG